MSHYIPTVDFRPRHWLGIIPASALLGGSLFLHRGDLSAGHVQYPAAIAIWGVMMTFILVQLVLSWMQRPVVLTTEEERARVASLTVAVVIPCYNEDPQILDRTIFSVLNQTRLPNYLVVVDDGSKVDYSEVWSHWDGRPDFIRIRQPNAGKKHAQAAAFRLLPDMDIWATIDSDSALEARAIEEGMKPFADEEVTSVAGLEMAYNFKRNLLTRAIGMRSIAFQLYTMSAQGSMGEVLINPGAFSLYRGWLIQKILPGYLKETFFGEPVTLGDDTALTMYSLAFGVARHQPTAVSFPVYPETVSHHLRQWTRWMRASTIRTFWRLRYLPLRSYIWLFVVWQQWIFLASVTLTVVIVADWPVSEPLALAGSAALLAWPLGMAVRLATLKRSDQSWIDTAFGIFLLPFAAVWYLLVLRQIRFYGMATCHRQGWVTRNKVEVAA